MLTPRVGPTRPISTPNNGSGLRLDIRFSHVQLYVDRVAPLAEYKALESSLNEFHRASFSARDEAATGGTADVDGGRRLWNSLRDSSTSSNETNEETSPSFPFATHGRDVVRQLLSGFDFRVTGVGPEGHGTDSVLVASGDPRGVRIVVTSAEASADEEEGGCEETKGGGGRYLHFDAGEFYSASV